jgi:imidazoleglycerol-phosphate dehydratase
MNRAAEINRETKETTIQLKLDLDGQGHSQVETGIGFFNHMLETLSRHSGIDLDVRAKGDLDVDEHHTVEDTGICFGEALKKALGDKKGIGRFGWALCPMDESLARACIDLSGRGTFSGDISIASLRISGLIEFFKGAAMGGGFTLHLDVLRGNDGHHVMEAVFKSFARALRQAVDRSGRGTDIPSTKGML